MGFRVQGSGFRVQGLGFRVWGSDFVSPRVRDSRQCFAWTVSGCTRGVAIVDESVEVDVRDGQPLEVLDLRHHLLGGKRQRVPERAR